MGAKDQYEEKEKLHQMNAGLRELLRESLNFIYTANYLRTQEGQIEDFLKRCREADVALPAVARPKRDELVAIEGRVTEVGPPTYDDTCKVIVETWGRRRTAIEGVPKERARDFLGRLVEVILRRA